MNRLDFVIEDKEMGEQELKEENKKLKRENRENRAKIKQLEEMINTLSRSLGSPVLQPLTLPIYPNSGGWTTRTTPYIYGGDSRGLSANTTGNTTGSFTLSSNTYTSAGNFYSYPTTHQEQFSF